MPSVREYNLHNNFLGLYLPSSLFSILLRTRLPQSWHRGEVYCIKLLLLSHRVIEKLKILSKNLRFAARCNFPPVLLCSQNELDLIQKEEIRSGDLRHTLLRKAGTVSAVQNDGWFDLLIHQHDNLKLAWADGNNARF